VTGYVPSPINCIHAADNHEKAKPDFTIVCIWAAANGRFLALSDYSSRNSAILDVTIPNYSGIVLAGGLDKNLGMSMKSKIVEIGRAHV